MPGGRYRTIIVPHCRFMPLETLEELIKLSREGATIIVHQHIPGDVPGWADLQVRRKHLKEIFVSFKLRMLKGRDIFFAEFDKGKFLIGDNLEQMLSMAGVSREPIADTAGVKFIRRSHGQGYHYFITNLGDTTLDDWVTLGTVAKSAVIFDPLFPDKKGLAAVRQTSEGQSQCYLQLPPGRSCILRSFTDRKIDGPDWFYGQRQDSSYPLQGTWKITFIEGGPKLPGEYETKRLASWTESGDTEAKRFAGTGRYRIRFEKPEGKADDWLLELGRVAESAKVFVNSQYVGTLFSEPFEIAVGKFLRAGQNTLEVEVTNLMANRIADMDRRGVRWKKFHDINFFSSKGKKFDASDWPLRDSGLLGPVRLIALQKFDPQGG